MNIPTQTPPGGDEHLSVWQHEYVTLESEVGHDDEQDFTVTFDPRTVEIVVCWY